MVSIPWLSLPWKVKFSADNKSSNKSSPYFQCFLNPLPFAKPFIFLPPNPSSSWSHFIQKTPACQCFCNSPLHPSQLTTSLSDSHSILLTFFTFPFFPIHQAIFHPVMFSWWPKAGRNPIHLSRRSLSCQSQPAALFLLAASDQPWHLCWGGMFANFQLLDWKKKNKNNFHFDLFQVTSMFSLSREDQHSHLFCKKMKTLLLVMENSTLFHGTWWVCKLCSYNEYCSESSVNLYARAHVPLVPGGSGEIHALLCRGHFCRWKGVCWGEGIIKETLSLSVMF